MKQIEAYLNTQKELAYMAYSDCLQKGGNLFDAKHWLERIVHLELMIKDLQNGKKKRAEA